MREEELGEEFPWPCCQRRRAARQDLALGCVPPRLSLSLRALAQGCHTDALPMAPRAGGGPWEALGAVGASGEGAGPGGGSGRRVSLLWAPAAGWPCTSLLRRGLLASAFSSAHRLWA